MAKGKVSASYNIKSHKINITLSLLTWEDNDVTYVYSPALDLTGYGKTKVEAKKSFEITLEEFIEYTHNKNTIYDELERLGWTINRKKQRAKQPIQEELLKDNDFLKSLMNKDGVKKLNREVSLVL